MAPYNWETLADLAWGRPDAKLQAKMVRKNASYRRFEKRWFLTLELREVGGSQQDFPLNYLNLNMFKYIWYLPISSYSKYARIQLHKPENIKCNTECCSDAMSDNIPVVLPYLDWETREVSYNWSYLQNMIWTYSSIFLAHIEFFTHYHAFPLRSEFPVGLKIHAILIHTPP